MKNNNNMCIGKRKSRREREREGKESSRF